MSDAQPADEIPEIGPHRALDHARMYWEGLRRFGELGEPTVLEMGEIQTRHAEMARTAALVSIAESLDRLADNGARRAQARRLASLDSNVALVAKEITKIRYIMK